MLTGKGKIDDFIIMEMLSQEYGWTPREIRKQRYSDIKTYVDIISVRNLIEKANLKRNASRK